MVVSSARADVAAARVALNQAVVEGRNKLTQATRQQARINMTLRSEIYQKQQAVLNKQVEFNKLKQEHIKLDSDMVTLNRKAGQLQLDERQHQVDVQTARKELAQTRTQTDDERRSHLAERDALRRSVDEWRNQTQRMQAERAENLRDEAQLVNELSTERRRGEKRNRTMTNHLSHDSRVKDSLLRLKSLEDTLKEAVGSAISELNTAEAETAPSPPPAPQLAAPHRKHG